MRITSTAVWVDGADSEFVLWLSLALAFASLVVTGYFATLVDRLRRALETAYRAVSLWKSRAFHYRAIAKAQNPDAPDAPGDAEWGDAADAPQDASEARRVYETLLAKFSLEDMESLVFDMDALKTAIRDGDSVDTRARNIAWTAYRREVLGVLNERIKNAK